MSMRVFAFLLARRRRGTLLAFVYVTVSIMYGTNDNRMGYAVLRML